MSRFRIVIEPGVKRSVETTLNHELRKSFYKDMAKLSCDPYKFPSSSALGPNNLRHAMVAGGMVEIVYLVNHRDIEIRVVRFQRSP